MRLYEARELAKESRWAELKAYVEAKPLTADERAAEQRADETLTKHYGYALLLAALASTAESTEAALALIGAGANLHYRITRGVVDGHRGEQGGDTPLHVAARNNNKALTQALLRAGANIALLNESPSGYLIRPSGRTAIVVAAFAHNWEIVKIFAETRPLRAEERTQEKDKTDNCGACYGLALLLAARVNLPLATEAAVALIAAGADITWPLSERLSVALHGEKAGDYAFNFATLYANETLKTALTASIEKLVEAAIPNPNISFKANLQFAFAIKTSAEQAAIIRSWRDPSAGNEAKDFVTTVISSSPIFFGETLTRMGAEAIARRSLRTRFKIDAGTVGCIFYTSTLYSYLSSKLARDRTRELAHQPYLKELAFKRTQKLNELGVRLHFSSSIEELTAIEAERSRLEDFENKLRSELSDIRFYYHVPAECELNDELLLELKTLNQLIAGTKDDLKTLEIIELPFGMSSEALTVFERRFETLRVLSSSLDNPHNKASYLVLLDQLKNLEQWDERFKRLTQLTCNQHFLVTCPEIAATIAEAWSVVTCAYISIREKLTKTATAEPLPFDFDSFFARAEQLSLLSAIYALFETEPALESFASAKREALTALRAQLLSANPTELEAIKVELTQLQSLSRRVVGLDDELNSLIAAPPTESGTKIEALLAKRSLALAKLKEQIKSIRDEAGLSDLTNLKTQLEEADEDLKLVLSHSTKLSKEIAADFPATMLEDIHTRYQNINDGTAIASNLIRLTLRAHTDSGLLSSTTNAGLFGRGIGSLNTTPAAIAGAGIAKAAAPDTSSGLASWFGWGGAGRA